MDAAEADAMALIATEWSKAALRALRLGYEASPARFARERALLTSSERRVSDALEVCGLRLHDFDGQPYSAALPVEPVNPEDFDSEEGLIVLETIEPTVLRDGRVLLPGKAILAREPR